MKNPKHLKNSVLCAISAVGILACQADTGGPDGGIDPDAAPNLTGKADGADDFTIEPGQNFDRVVLRGPSALDLYRVYDRAGGLTRLRRRGLDYRYGSYTLCVSNGTAAACELYTRDARADSADFPLTLHGPSSGSAADEMFGALARASGVNAGAVNVVDSDLFVCGRSGQDTWCGLQEGGTDDGPATLELSFDGLENVGPNFVYEGWLITDDGPVTSGRFQISDNSVSGSLEVDADLARRSQLFVLTIEPRVDPDPGPTDTHVLAGAFENGQADLTVSHPAALGTSFGSAAGGFILETPTTADIAADYGKGVWFIEPAAGPGAGLDLPELPAGWVYEGWVVGDNGPISTGTFVDPADADSDGAGPTAGPDGSPPFPGQDFIDPAIDLRSGFAVVLSVEPSPDTSPAPFALKPLMGEIRNAGQGVFQGLDNISADTNASGTAVLR